MSELLIGYARVSTYEQDLTAQRKALEELGVQHWRLGPRSAGPRRATAVQRPRNGGGV
uniref:recombinase family protein n=1 Tax=Microbacterium pygmaeum TaxID=370764 RepID=UPI0038B236F5